MGPLAAGATQSLQTVVLIPANVTPGNYYVLVEMDNANIVVEGDETNNVAASPQLTVENRAPSADAGGPYSVNEGDSLQLVGSGIDPDGETDFTYAWDLDNDGTFEFAGRIAAFSAMTLDGPAWPTGPMPSPTADPSTLAADRICSLSDSPPS